MRQIFAVFLAILMTTFFAATNLIFAQDPLEVGPDIYKKKFENDHVRVLEARLEPGASIGTHSHPDHFIYVLEEGKVELAYPDGKTKDMDLKAEDVNWMDAETHSAKNTGDSVVRLLVVELKH